mmetsp:Transcript_56644/g.171424  ORF Transcript_56644/g.171424 Transcript_56644/m.171424 type:complete len:260 (-) Transcript_56644:218-997(-)
MCSSAWLASEETEGTAQACPASSAAASASAALRLTASAGPCAICPRSATAASSPAAARRPWASTRARGSRTSRSLESASSLTRFGRGSAASEAWPSRAAALRRMCSSLLPARISRAAEAVELPVTAAAQMASAEARRTCSSSLDVNRVRAASARWLPSRTFLRKPATLDRRTCSSALCASLSRWLITAGSSSSLPWLLLRSPCARAGCAPGAGVASNLCLVTAPALKSTVSRRAPSAPWAIQSSKLCSVSVQRSPSSSL